jgi:hypothetical protein
MLGGLIYVANKESEIERTKQVTLSLGTMKLFLSEAKNHISKSKVSSWNWKFIFRKNLF